MTPNTAKKANPFKADLPVTTVALSLNMNALGEK
jgi:hypothetical protein